METLVRNVIAERGLPFAVLSVIPSPAGWNIRIRAGTGGMIRFAVPAGPPLAVRVAIQDRLTADL